jgi:ATP-dependent DNA helicase RecG
MNETDIKNMFDHLRSQAESETVEFKKAENNFDSSELGKYFSALSNEANLQGLRCSWLIFGVHDKTRAIIGTSYRNDKIKLQSLKHELAQKTTNNLTFSNIFEHYEMIDGKQKRVILFEIPAAPQGVPIAYNGHYYGRDGESLVALNLHEIETIRHQRAEDWSANIVQDATIQDLDAEAINKARFEYKKKNPDMATEIAEWDDTTFLNKARLTINGKITNTSLILLGTEYSAHYLNPAVAQITWILKDGNGIEMDYKHLKPPFLLSVDKVLNSIRNITFRYMPDNSLFPDEVMQYDNYVIREALHNCIAHQDYSLRERINVIEYPEKLIFSNGGSFIPKTIENVILQDAPQRYYRNTFLCAAMVNLNMIDTIGSGIKRMFISQRKRFFPLPDYNISENAIDVTIYGKIINPNYVRLLKSNLDISLLDIIALDKIQKKLPIPLEVANRLKRRGLITGRKNNYYLSDTVALAVDEMAEYVQNKAFNKKYYIDFSYELIKKQNSKGTTRKEINSLLITKLSKTMTEKQKDNYIRNMLHQMVIENKIVSIKKKYYLKSKN